MKYMIALCWFCVQLPLHAMQPVSPPQNPTHRYDYQHRRAHKKIITELQSQKRRATKNDVNKLQGPSHVVINKFQDQKLNGSR